MSCEEDVKRIEKKVDLLFKLCFKDASNFTFGSFTWDEIKESVPLFNLSAKKVNVNDFLPSEEIDKYLEKVSNLIHQVRHKYHSMSNKRYHERDILDELNYDPDNKMTGLEIQQKKEELERQNHEGYRKKLEKEEELRNIIETMNTIRHDWFNTTWGNNLKENIEKNYRAQFLNDLFKKLGMKRRENDCAEYIGKAIQENKQLKEIFMKIDNYNYN